MADGASLHRTGTRITLRPRATDSAALKALSRMCPSRCFRFDENERIAFDAAGCIWCGICRIVCGRTGEVEWRDAAPGWA